MKGGFISSLKRKAFAIELTDNYEVSYLLIDEIINDEEFYWQNQYIFEDKESFGSL